LECLVKHLKEEIEKLKKKVKLLEYQNAKLIKENANLKQQLGETLETLRILCAKYKALKKKCRHDSTCDKSNNSNRKNHKKYY